jgi:hypothetical protein
MEVEPALHEFGWIAFEVAPRRGLLASRIRGRSSQRDALAGVDLPIAGRHRPGR